LKREQVIKHIIKSVKDSQPKGMSETGNEIVNKVYQSVKPNASRQAKSAIRKTILSGDYFGTNFAFFLELLDQCDLDVVERKS